jgi:hypothetical protein
MLRILYMFINLDPCSHYSWFSTSPLPTMLWLIFQILSLYGFIYIFVCFFDTGSLCIAQTDLEFAIFLPQPPEKWDYSLEQLFVGLFKGLLTSELQNIVQKTIIFTIPNHSKSPKYRLRNGKLYKSTLIRSMCMKLKKKFVSTSLTF